MPVTAGSWQSFDLLRRRRQQLGLEVVQPTSSKDLLVSGGLIAGALVSLAALIWLGTAFYSRWLKLREDSLKPVGTEYQLLQNQLTGLQDELRRRTTANQALADAIASVASSSVLLAELAVLTPQDVQLSSAVQQQQQLTLTGTAFPPNGLRSINALQLNLETSPLFVPEQVQVVKILEQAGAESAVATGTGGLNFEIKLEVAKAARRANLALLQSRGASGLLRRLQVLRQEGLLR